MKQSCNLSHPSNNKKDFTVYFWLVVFGALFIFLQTYSRFYFYYMEQNQYFQISWPYLKEHLFKQGGLASVISGFLFQFFLFPYTGAVITSALLTGAGYLMYGMVRRIAPHSGLLIACLLPVIALMLIHFNVNYLMSGTIACLLALIALNLMLRVKKNHKRIIFHLLAIAILFFLAGSICMLYALVSTIYEISNKQVMRYFLVLIVLEMLLIGLASNYFLVYTSYRFVYLPDNYFNYQWLPGTLIYLSWISILLIVAVACYIGKQEKRKRPAFFIAQIFLVVCCCGLGIRYYGLGEQSKIMELDYYSRTEQWDEILVRSKGASDSYLRLCYVNMALAQKGELGDKAFSYEQAGVEGLIIPWDKSAYTSTLLSDIYFAMNDIALSQKMAFEVFVISGNPRMLKRLVQTNLIYGAYPVAEKYIGILENMYGYRKWANSHRRFLYHDSSVDKDELLGSKRKSLVKTNYLSKIEGLDMDLQQLAAHNPSDRASIEYAGVMYLLEKDIDNFRQMLEVSRYANTFPQLPVSFQEAILILSLKEPDYWKQYDIPESTVQRFSDFMKSRTKTLYGDTFWYYYFMSGGRRN